MQRVKNSLVKAAVTFLFKRSAFSPIISTFYGCNYAEIILLPGRENIVIYAPTKESSNFRHRNLEVHAGAILKLFRICLGRGAYKQITASLNPGGDCRRIDNIHITIAAVNIILLQYGVKNMCSTTIFKHQLKISQSSISKCRNDSNTSRVVRRLICPSSTVKEN